MCSITLVLLLTISDNTVLGWVTPIRDQAAHPHFIDVQLQGTSARKQLERAHATFSILKDELNTLNDSAVFRKGGTKWLTKSDNQIQLFAEIKGHLEDMINKMGSSFSQLLSMPPLSSTTPWPYASRFSCDKVISINLPLYQTLVTTVQLEKTNWQSPANPRNPDEVWTNKLQQQLEAMMAKMTAAGESYNSTELRLAKMQENYRTVIQRVFTQRYDTLALIPQLLTHLKSLHQQLENYLALLNSCSQHSTSGKTLAFLACPRALPPITVQNYQIDDLSCQASSSRITVTMRLHQQNLLFPEGSFQKIMLSSATFSTILSLVTYSYLAAKLWQRLTKHRNKQRRHYYPKQSQQRRVNHGKANNVSALTPAQQKPVDTQYHDSTDSRLQTMVPDQIPNDPSSQPANPKNYKKTQPFTK